MDQIFYFLAVHTDRRNSCSGICYNLCCRQ